MQKLTVKILNVYLITYCFHVAANHELNKDLSSQLIQQSKKELVANTPLKTIYQYQTFFKDSQNMPQLQRATPKTLYMWQNMSRILKTEMILRDGSISELPLSINPNIASLLFERKDGKPITVNGYFHENPMDAMIVIHKGTIIHEQYKTMRPFDKHNWFSTGKTIAGTMIALLEEEGKVDVSKPVSSYLPLLKNSAWDTVSVLEVLDMATGLDSTEHEEPNDDSTTNPERGWYQWAVTMGLFTGSQSDQSPFNTLKQMNRTKPGNTAFEYNSINTWVLELIVEQVTNKPFSEAFGEAVWRRIGAEADGFIGITPDGYSMGWGFTSSTLRDLARYGMIYTPSWNKVSRQRIISEKILNNIQKGGNPAIFDKGLVGKQMLETFYETKLTNRYQWDVVFEDGDFYKEGVGGQGLYVSSSRDLIIAWFSTGENNARVMARAIATSKLFKSQ